MSESLKDIATSFLRMAAAGDARAAFDRYASPSFRHHNAYFKGDAASLAAAMDQNAREHPQKTFDIAHAIAEGDFVAVHSRVRLDPNGQDNAVVHLFRFGLERRLMQVGCIVPDRLCLSADVTGVTPRPCKGHPAWRKALHPLRRAGIPCPVSLSSPADSDRSQDRQG